MQLQGAQYEYVDRGLRLIEVDKRDLIDLLDIVNLPYANQKRFLLCCDDLSFEADNISYKALRTIKFVTSLSGF